MGPCATLLPQFYTNPPILLSRPRLSSPGSPWHLGASGCFLCCFGFGLILLGVFNLQLLQWKLSEIPVKFIWLLSDWIFISLVCPWLCIRRHLSFPPLTSSPGTGSTGGGVGGAGVGWGWGAVWCLVIRLPCRGCLILFCRLSSSLRQKASLLKVEMNPPRTFWSSVCCNI